MKKIVFVFLYILACVWPVIAATNLTVVVDGPNTVVQGRSVLIITYADKIEGEDEMALVSFVVPPKMSVEFMTMNMYCCGDKVWRMAGLQAFRVRVDADAPTGSHNLTVSYQPLSTGIVRTTVFPLTVTAMPPAPAPKASTAAPELPSVPKWEKQMADYGIIHCRVPSLWEGDPWYYDGERVFYQIAAYTKQTGWNACADYIEQTYRKYVLDNKGATGWRVFPHGLRMDWQLTGDLLSKEAVLILSQGAYASPASNPSFIGNTSTVREVAYAIQAHVEVVKTGVAKNEYLEFLVDVGIGYLNRYFVSRDADTPQPFMISLLAEALINYHSTINPDPRIPFLLKLAADDLMLKHWDPVSKSFWYYDSAAKYPAPDLNLLIVPLFGWVYQNTGEVAYRDFGDTVFTSGVDQAWLNGGKQYMQNYRWSFDYLRWRTPPVSETTAAKKKARALKLLRELETLIGEL